jgi:hypothetical protein
MRRQSLLIFLTAFTWTASAAAQSLTNQLTAEEVACNETQMAKLLERTTFGDPIVAYNQLPKTLIVSYSNPYGFYEGLALTNQDWRLGPFGVPPFPPPPEHYLAFNLNPSVRTLLLDPRRPMLGQVALNREQSGSNFVTPGGYFDLAVKIDPTLKGSIKPDLLVINNFLVPSLRKPYNGFIANSTKAGRGLTQDGLLTSCHTRFTDFDRHVFAVLQRLIRASTRSYSIFIVLDLKIAVFRGERPNLYRVNIYPIDAYSPEIPDPRPSGQVALEIEVSWTQEGRLKTATLRGLPRCEGGQRLGCTLSEAATEIYLIPPVLGGTEYLQGHSEGVIHDPANGIEFTPPAIVDLESLLVNSTWNSWRP